MASAWPTPTGRDSVASGAAAYSTESGRHSGTTLTDAAVREAEWQTPVASRSGWNDRGEAKLRGQANRWPTPQAADAEARGPHGNGQPTLASSGTAWPTPVARVARHGTTGTRDQLPDATKAWATPTAGFSRSTPPEHSRGGRSLAADLERWPTPTAGPGTGYMSGTDRNVWRPSLAAAAQGSRPTRGRRPPTTASAGPTSSPSAPTSPLLCLLSGTTGTKATSTQPTLNPRFVEYLMGLPPGFSAARPQAGLLADRVDRLRCLGNCCLPAQAELALCILLRRAVP